MRDTYKNSLTPEQNSENLNDSNLCPICHGTGWVVREIDGKSVASQCRCYQKSVLERRIRFAELPEKLKGMRLSTFSINAYQTPYGKEKARIACKIIKQYLDNFTEEKKSGMGLYIYSSAKGSGKTRMAASIANELMLNGDTPVKFATSPQILTEIRRTYDRQSEDTESQLLHALSYIDVLVIDDFGTEKVTDWVKNKFYEIINGRYVNQKITIFTSNESLDTLQYDERITNRIKEMCYQIDFPEESVREHIAEKNMHDIIKKAIG